MTLSACVASYLLNGSGLEITLGIFATLAVGTAFGLMNGLDRRLWPPAADHRHPCDRGHRHRAGASSAAPAGRRRGWRPGLGADQHRLGLRRHLRTRRRRRCLVAGPLRRHPGAADPAGRRGRSGLAAVQAHRHRAHVYAIGSAEGAAYVSGLPINRAKLAAFTLAGFFSACAGLYLALQTSTGNADTVQAGAYTLNSIAAVVLGGTALAGGIGGAIASHRRRADPAGDLVLLPHPRHRARCCNR